LHKSVLVVQDTDHSGGISEEVKKEGDRFTQRNPVTMMLGRGRSFLIRHVATPLRLVNTPGRSALPAFVASSSSSLSSSFDGRRGMAHVSIANAKTMPRHYNQMPSDVLLVMAAGGDQDAREERVIREIMAVDNVEWPAARQTFLKIVDANRRGLFFATLPYKVGITVSFTAGVLSFPLIFHLDSVLMFNDLFVTTDVPDDKDLETPLEVGSWAWNWMEPPLGQISFFPLCMQYARAQLENLGAKVCWLTGENHSSVHLFSLLLLLLLLLPSKPYTAWYKARRAARLVREFPTYDKHILTSFSENDSFSPVAPDPVY